MNTLQNENFTGVNHEGQRLLQKWKAILGQYIMNTKKFGEPVYDRIKTMQRINKRKIKKLSASQIKNKDLAGERIKNILTYASANDAQLAEQKL